LRLVAETFLNPTELPQSGDSALVVIRNPTPLPRTVAPGIGEMIDKPTARPRTVAPALLVESLENHTLLPLGEGSALVEEMVDTTTPVPPSSSSERDGAAS
jgi:hypothetical protein